MPYTKTLQALTKLQSALSEAVAEIQAAQSGIPKSQSTLAPLDVPTLQPAFKTADIKFEATCRVEKSNDEAQILFGWASVAVAKDGQQVVDAHSDVIAIEDLELAAYDFMLKSRASGEDHAGTTDAEVVESMVFTPEKLDALGIAKGTVPYGWFIGVHIPDAGAYQRAKTSKQMFSIEGTATREELPA